MRKKKTAQVLVGKGHQQMHATDTGIQVSDTMQHKRTGYVLWRALVDQAPLYYNSSVHGCERDTITGCLPSLSLEH